MRINRIPSSMRNRKMQDLLDEHAEKANPKPAPPLPAREQQPVIGSARKQLKRQRCVETTTWTIDDVLLTRDLSDQISTTSEDQENESQDLLPNPKKRARPNTSTTTANTKAIRAASSRKEAMLSPKSHNSQPVPRSPLRFVEKSSACPTSPTKPLRAPPAKSAPTRKPSRQQLQSKKNGSANVQEEAEGEGRSSDASTTSAGTTVVRKEGAGGKGKAGAAKQTAAASTKSAVAAKKSTGAGSKKDNVPPVTATGAGGGRSLRKRG